jgi:uncharacterized membrane protein YbhN (UPF0104 family)
LNALEPTGGTKLPKYGVFTNFDSSILSNEVSDFAQATISPQSFRVTVRLPSQYQRYNPTTVLTTRRVRQLALTALLFAVILSLLLLLLAPHNAHSSGDLLPWLCFAPFLLFAESDFRRILIVTGSTVEKHLSPALAHLSHFQLPPPSHRS